MRIFLSCKAGDVGVTAKESRLFFDVRMHRYRAGMPRRDLPQRFSAPTAFHTRVSHWAKAGVWDRVFSNLAADADKEYTLIDSTIVRDHQHIVSASQKAAEHQAEGAPKVD